jgi:hypothetical protein
MKEADIKKFIKRVADKDEEIKQLRLFIKEGGAGLGRFIEDEQDEVALRETEED